MLCLLLFPLWPQRSQDVSLAQEGALSLPPPPLIRVGIERDAKSRRRRPSAHKKKKKEISFRTKKGNSAPVSSSFRVRPYSPFLSLSSPPLFALRIPVAILSSLRLRLRGRERGERKEEEKGKIRFRLSISHAHLLKKRNLPTFTKRAEKSFYSSVGIDIHELHILISIWWIPHPRLPKGWWWLSSGLFRWWSRKEEEEGVSSFPFFFSIGLYPFKSDPIRKKEEKAAFPFFSMEKEEDRRNFLGHKKAFKNIYSQCYLTKKFVLRRRIFSP